MICTCKDPMTLGVVHRADAPCYIPEQRHEQEPFGYFRYDMRLDAWVMNREGQRPGTPFYTTPPQRKPLTDEEMKKIWYAMQNIMGWYSFQEIARAIEAAHGIKGEA